MALTVIPKRAPSCASALVNPWIPLLAAANFGSQVLLGATGSYRLIFVVQIGLLLSGGALLALIQIPPAERPSA